MEETYEAEVVTAGEGVKTSFGVEVGVVADEGVGGGGVVEEGVVKEEADRISVGSSCRNEITFGILLISNLLNNFGFEIDLFISISIYRYNSQIKVHPSKSNILLYIVKLVVFS